METDLSPLKSAEVVTMDTDQALEAFGQYKEAVRRSHSAADKLLAQTYKALAAGHGILNVHAAIKKAGVDQQTFLPKLAIMRADRDFVFFRRQSHGSGFFSFSNRYYLQRSVKQAKTSRIQFAFPDGTFEHPQADCSYPRNFWWIHSAPLPLIPPQFRPADDLAKYCILWEVEKWEAHEPPSDPMLLKPIGQSGLYVVLAHWDLTPIERMVLGGLLAQ